MKVESGQRYEESPTCALSFIRVKANAREGSSCNIVQRYHANNMPQRFVVGASDTAWPSPHGLCGKTKHQDWSQHAAWKSTSHKKQSSWASLSEDGMLCRETCHDTLAVNRVQCATDSVGPIINGTRVDVMERRGSPSSVVGI